MRLRVTPEFQAYMEMLARFGEETTKTLVMNEKLDSGQLYQLRGRAQAYVSMIETIVQAPAQLDKHTQRDHDHGQNLTRSQETG